MDAFSIDGSPILDSRWLKHLRLLVAAGLLELLVLVVDAGGVIMFRGHLVVGVVGSGLLLLLGTLMLSLRELLHVLGRDQVGHPIRVVGDDGHG